MPASGDIRGQQLRGAWRAAALTCALAAGLGAAPGADATPRTARVAGTEAGGPAGRGATPAPAAPADAAADPAALCEAAARNAARLTGVPPEVLMALALTESGRHRGGRMRPWPWTVNVEGEGRWFDSRAAAVAHVEARRAAGARSFDIGCFQINHRWHGQAFASPDAMFDPEANALYAARFLAQLAAQSGGWAAAAGAYHSRTPALADRYRRRFETLLAGLPAPEAAAPAPRAAPPPARRPGSGQAGPLIAAGPPASAGSLFARPAARGGGAAAAPRPLLAPGPGRSLLSDPS